MDRFRWIDTLGGPHIMMPAESLLEWKGSIGSTDLGLDDPSDYARACRHRSLLGLVTCGEHEAIVFSGDVGSMAWSPRRQGGGTLVMWLACDGEEVVEALLQDETGYHSIVQAANESLSFSAGASGEMTLFDAVEAVDQRFLDGQSLSPQETLLLLPGRYTVSASFVDRPSLSLVIYDVAPRAA